MSAIHLPLPLLFSIPMQEEYSDSGRGEAVSRDRLPITVITDCIKCILAETKMASRLPLHPSCTPRSTNKFFLDVPRFSAEFVYRPLGALSFLAPTVSIVDYLLTSDFHPLSTPSNAVWKLTFSNSPPTPLPCCPPSDFQRLWFSIIIARVINACIFF